MSEKFNIGKETSIESLGDITQLSTEKKGNLVEAVNEVSLKGDTGYINLSSYCTLDGKADDTDGLVKAVDDARAKNKGLYLPLGKTLRITRPVSCRWVRLINFEGHINVDFSGTGLDIGGKGVALEPEKIYIRSASAPNGEIAIRVVGAKAHYITIHYASYIQIYANGNDAWATSSAYSQYFIGRADKLELYGVNRGWINENTFLINRIRHIILTSPDGSYSHNNNTFYRGCMEGEGGQITVLNGSSNHFTDFRFEAGPINITFAEGTTNNIVTQQWTSTVVRGLKTYDDINVKVIDSGNQNIVQFSKEPYLEEKDIFVLNSETKMIGDAAECSPNGDHNPGFDKVGIYRFSNIFDTGIIPAPQEDVIIGISGDASLYRPYVYCYDANKQPITTDPGYVSFEGNTPLYSSNGYYYTGVSLSWNLLVLKKNNPKVAYVRVAFSQYTTGWGTARVYIKHKKGADVSRIINARRTVAVSKPITKGHVGLGEIVPKTTGGFYQCTFSLKTELSALASSDATSVVVVSATGVQVGDIVGVLLDDRTTHWTTVSSVTGTNIGLAKVLPSKAAVGLTVGFNRWVDRP